MGTEATGVAVNPAICPLCGQPNDCVLAAQGHHQGPCWCWTVRPAPEALRRVPPAYRNKACLCRHCLTRSEWPAEDTSLHTP